MRAGTVAPPPLPGVYAFRDAAAQLVYVGTSRSLARRVVSYFAAGHPPASKPARIARLATRVEWETTPSVLEALVLEARTIAGERPHFNRRLKHPGRHVYVRFDVRDPFPRLDVTRALEEGSWRYLGPFPAARPARVAVERLADALGLRTCAGVIEPDPAGRACLRLDLGQCAAPCLGRTTAGVYGRQIARALAALGGGHPEVGRRAGARSGPLPAAFPAPVAAALAALRASRRALRVLVAVPAAGGTGQRVLAIAGGRLRAAETVTAPDAVASAVGRLARTLAQAPPLVVAREELDEVRIVTAWLASPAGRRSAVDLDRVGRDGACAWIASRLVPGPLFTTAGR